MTGNPLSGHTNHNMPALSGSASAVDGLADGDHIVSPTLTNMLEGVHGNGVILEEDTANGASNRSVPENLPGVCEQVTNSYTFTVTGGHAIVDGLMYAFAGGPGSSANIDITTSSAHKTGSPSALTSGQEALVVVYVSSDGGSANNIYWEMGSAVTAASNTYPSAPSSFLNFPDSSLTVKQSVVLAVLRVVYSASGGDLKVSISESNDKRVFVRPSPLYFSPVTTGAVGAANAPVDLHTELDNLHGGGDEAGDFTGSRFGALWQSHGSQISSTTAGDNQKDVLYYSATHAARYTRSVFDRILTSTATSIDITSADANILILTPGGAGAVTTSGPFPAGYIIEIENLHASNDLTFALTNSTTSTVSAGGYGRFICTVSHASDPTFVRVNDGLLEASEIHITTSGVGDALIIESTDAGATDAPDLILYRNSASPAVNDMIGSIKFRGKDLGGNDVDYVELETKLTDVTDGSEDSKLQVNMLRNGASVELFTVGKSECVINEASTTMDFRVESDSNANMLFVDASADAVGIGINTPTAPLHVRTTGTGDAFIVESTDADATGAPDIVFYRNSASQADSDDLGHIKFRGRNSANSGDVEFVDIYSEIAEVGDSSANKAARLFFRVQHANSITQLLQLRGKASGSAEVIVNDNGDSDIDFRVESDNNANMLFVDASADAVGIGTNAPTAPLHVESTGTDDTIIVESTSADANHAPDIIFYRNSASAADNDGIGHIKFRGKNDAGSPEDVDYADFYGTIRDSTDGTEDGELNIRTMVNGALANRIHIDPTEIVINEDSADLDFRVESNGNANMIFVEGSSDSIGIGINNPSATLDLLTGGTFRNTRLLTVSVSGGTTLTEAAHAGRYNICAGNVTLPSTSTAGEHYAILNTTGGNITIARNGNNINGAGSDFTLATFKAATCIAIGSNNWMVVG